MPLLEIACFNPQSAAIAAAAGADRIELCENQAAGGTTPPKAWLRQIKAAAATAAAGGLEKREKKIPIFVMIRPRGGDFYYSDAEFEEMKAQIDAFQKEEKIDGFVFGLLDKTHPQQIDISRTKELVQRAKPLPCTFHRAFDSTANPMQALEDVVAAGCSAILSSGGARDAGAGAAVLQQLVQASRGRITIIAGGGVRLSNIEGICATAGVHVCHSSA
ncbi:uncharacterized protein SEPMUDRAFT_84503, partial [Sphaerulina musiva SO2202]